MHVSNWSFVHVSGAVFMVITGKSARSSVHGAKKKMFRIVPELRSRKGALSNLMVIWPEALKAPPPHPSHEPSSQAPWKQRSRATASGIRAIKVYDFST